MVDTAEGMNGESGADMETPLPEGDMARSGGGSSEAQVFGDHIIVNNVTLKNEPKIMAAAIRTMLAKDE